MRLSGESPRQAQQVSNELVSLFLDENLRKRQEAARETSAFLEAEADRLAEVVSRIGWQENEIVVNLQGDEPLMPPDCLDQVAGLLASHPDADVASLFDQFADEAAAGDPNATTAPWGRDTSLGTDEVSARRWSDAMMESE